MGYITFVVEYPDGEEPAICKGVDRNGGELVSASFTDLAEENELLEEKLNRTLMLLGVADRQHEEAESQVLKLITERDCWEDKATELADAVANEFGRDFGEHSSGNNPVQNAIDFLINT